jgi:hypothetical protein
MLAYIWKIRMINCSLEGSCISKELALIHHTSAVAQSVKILGGPIASIPPPSHALTNPWSSTQKYKCEDLALCYGYRCSLASEVKQTPYLWGQSCQSKSYSRVGDSFVAFSVSVTNVVY